MLVPPLKRKEIRQAAVVLLKAAYEKSSGFKNVRVYENVTQEQIFVPCVVVGVIDDAYDEETFAYTADLAATVNVEGDEGHTCEDIFAIVSQAFIDDNTVGGTVDETIYSEWTESDDEFEDGVIRQAAVWAMRVHAGNTYGVV